MRSCRDSTGRCTFTAPSRPDRERSREGRRASEGQGSCDVRERARADGQFAQLNAEYAADAIVLDDSQAPTE